MKRFSPALLALLFLAVAPACFAEPASLPASIPALPVIHSDLPNVGLSAIRALAALAFVLAIFFGGVWLFRNGQRLAWRKNGVPKLAILETRPLGNRFAIYVVGYEQQRLLIGSSPAGLSLLSQLPPGAAAAVEPAAAAPAGDPSFAALLQQTFQRK
jgi:flagellar biogenesis protein FliO